MASKKLKIRIDSDGTTGGTSLRVNGEELTKVKDIVDVSFSADGEYGRPYVNFNYSEAQKNEDGVTTTTRTRYAYSPEPSAQPESPSGELPPVLIGKDEELKEDAKFVGKDIADKAGVVDKILEISDKVPREELEGRTLDSLNDKLSDLQSDK